MRATRAKRAKRAGDTKMAPNLSQPAFDAIAARADMAAAWEAVRRPVYSAVAAEQHLSFEHSQYCLGGGGKPDADAANSFLARRGVEPWNTRVRYEADGALTVLLASVHGGEKAADEHDGRRIRIEGGDHSAALAVVCQHLRRAAEFAESERQARRRASDGSRLGLPTQG